MFNLTGVGDLIQEHQKFTVIDYGVFGIMLGSCVLIGIYFAYVDYQKGKEEKVEEQEADYFMGGRKMQIIPVALSLISSAVSGATMIGVTTEMYIYGTQFLFSLLGVFTMGFIVSYLYLPVFHGLNITSVYEYLQARFDHRMRLLCSTLFTLTILLSLPVTLYVTALTYSQMTGVNVYKITFIACLICIFYTSLGGMKAVVWTDSIQAMSILMALVLVAIKGTYDVGGLSVVLERNLASNRIELPNLDFNPKIRHTFWSVYLGSTFMWSNGVGVNQFLMQRFICLPTIGKARKSLKIFVVGVIFVIFLCGYNGLLVYARFYDCDPLTTHAVKARDQLVPLFVMGIFEDYPGLSGLFVAGVFSAALSTLSTCLNSMSVIILNDFIKPSRTQPLSKLETIIIMKGSAVLSGVVIVAMVFIVEKLGTVLQLSISLISASLAPIMGIFTMGIILPYVNATGALVGGITSSIVMFYICIRSQLDIMYGDLAFSTKPVSVEGCLSESYNSTIVFNGTPLEDYRYYHISYMYYSVLGPIVCIVVGVFVSYITGFNNPDDVHPQLIAPFLRKFYAKRGKKIDTGIKMKIYKFELKENQIT